MKHSPLLAACLALAAALSLADPAHAAPPKEGTLGTGKAGGPVLSMSQLRACLAQQARLSRQNDENLKMQQELSTERTELEGASAAIKDEMATLDRTNREAVEAYVAKAQANDKRIDTHQERVGEFNTKVEAVKAERASYAKSCEGRRYLEDDYKDIKAGK